MNRVGGQRREGEKRNGIPHRYLLVTSGGILPRCPHLPVTPLPLPFVCVNLDKEFPRATAILASNIQHPPEPVTQVSLPIHLHLDFLMSRTQDATEGSSSPSRRGFQHPLLRLFQCPHLLTGLSNFLNCPGLWSPAVCVQRANRPHLASVSSRRGCQGVSAVPVSLSPCYVC